MKKILSLFLLLLAIQINAQCWQSITVGESHSIGIKADGTLWFWGKNSYGELGDGTQQKKDFTNSKRNRSIMAVN